MKRVAWWGLWLLGAAGLLAAWAVVGGFWVQGGLMKVAAWYLGMMLPPAAGAFGLLHSLLLGVLQSERRILAGGVGVLSMVSLAPALILFGLWAPRYPADLATTTPAATVRLPLDGPIVVGWGGDTVKQNYHAAHPDQRWAYDLLVEPAGHGSADLESYGCYGLDVLAPAAGTVAIAHDGEPDQDPSTFVPNAEAPAGNYVALKLATDTYLVLAHMVPGSVAVEVGDEVTEGQVLGKCGNSGNTSEPHVHIHHVRQKPEVIGFGEGLPLYFRDHDGEPMPVGGIEVDGEDVRFVGDRVRHVGG